MLRKCCFLCGGNHRIVNHSITELIGLFFFEGFYWIGSGNFEGLPDDRENADKGSSDSDQEKRTQR